MAKTIIVVPCDIDGVLVHKKDGKFCLNIEFIKQIAHYIKEKIITNSKSDYKIIIQSGSRRFGIAAETLSINAGLSPLILEAFKKTLWEKLLSFPELNVFKERIEIESTYFVLGSYIEKDLNLAEERTVVGFAFDLKTTDSLKFAEIIDENQNTNLFYLKMAIQYFIDNQCLPPSQLKKLKNLTCNQLMDLSKKLDFSENEIEEYEKNEINGKIPDGNFVSYFFSDIVSKIDRGHSQGIASYAKLIACLNALYSVKSNANNVFLLLADDEIQTIHTYEKTFKQYPQLLPNKVNVCTFHVDEKNGHLIKSEDDIPVSSGEFNGKSNKTLKEISKIFNKEITKYLKTLPTMEKSNDKRTISKRKSNYQMNLHKSKYTFSINQFANTVSQPGYSCKLFLFCCPRNTRSEVNIIERTCSL